MDITDRTFSEEKTREIMVCLDRALRCADELLVLFSDEFAAIRRVDAESLVPLARRKTEHMARLKMLDDLLAEKVGSMLAEAGMSGRQSGQTDERWPRIIDLSALLPLVSEEFKQGVDRARILLAEKRQAIVAKNEINRRLVKDSLIFVSDAVKLITGALGRSGYRADGRNSSRLDGPSFISRAV